VRLAQSRFKLATFIFALAVTADLVTKTVLPPVTY